jgi:hypothetical protein
LYIYTYVYIVDINQLNMIYVCVSV